MDSDLVLSLVTIMIIGVVLSGDNALVIAMASLRLPRHLRKKAVFWGTTGAIVIRLVLAVVAVKLLQVPLLELTGGLLLAWIAYRLLVQDHEQVILRASSNYWSVVKKILVADTVMGFDNVLAIAGTAHGNMWVVFAGIVVSIPFIIWGSRLFVYWLDRFPIINYIGAAFIAWTAGTLIVQDDIANAFLQPVPYPEATVPLSLVMIVVLSGIFRNGGKPIRIF